MVKMTEKFIYPGSFDPFTIGHYAVLKQALQQFDAGVVAIGNNEQKSALHKLLFSKEQRQKMVQSALAEYARTDSSLNVAEKNKLAAVKVVVFDGLQVDAAIKFGCPVIVRGVRNQTDCELEEKLAYFNEELADIRKAQIKTLLLATQGNMRFVSSTDVKELCRIGEYRLVRKFVAPAVFYELMKIYLQREYVSVLQSLGTKADEKDWTAFENLCKKKFNGTLDVLVDTLNCLAIWQGKTSGEPDNKLKLAAFYRSCHKDDMSLCLQICKQYTGVEIEPETMQKLQMLLKNEKLANQQKNCFDLAV